MNTQIHIGSESLDKDQWDALCRKNSFLKLAFKQAFEKHHQKSILSLYYQLNGDNNKGIGYAQQFTVGGNKIQSYQKKNNVSQSIWSAVLGMLKLKVIALGNGLLTNVSNLHIEQVADKKLFVNALLSGFQQKLGVKKFIIPDHFFDELGIKTPTAVFPELIRVEVDEDMQMHIPPEWKTFEDYTQALKKKYRSRLKNVLKKSDSINIKQLGQEDLERHAQTMQKLFNNVHQNSAFGIAPFNTDIFKDLIAIQHPQCIVFGYFLNHKMIGFSSELRNGASLYSYFIGLDYGYNRSHRLYERILNQTIKGAIDNGKKQIVFGRTAAEFKSNVGAKPSQSFIYIYIKNPLLRTLLKPLLSRIKPKQWIQRNPFK